jgi:hypothetical protein
MKHYALCPATSLYVAVSLWVRHLPSVSFLEENVSIKLAKGESYIRKYAILCRLTE